jgi:hypothetical protein
MDPRIHTVKKDNRRQWIACAIAAKRIAAMGVNATDPNFYKITMNFLYRGIKSLIEVQGDVETAAKIMTKEERQTYRDRCEVMGISSGIQGG